MPKLVIGDGDARQHFDLFFVRAGEMGVTSQGTGNTSPPYSTDDVLNFFHYVELGDVVQW